MTEPEALGGRYRFVKRLKSPAKTVVWLAEDEMGGQVVASVISSARTKGLKPVVGLVHPHLATLFDVFEAVDASVLPPDASLGKKDPKVAVAAYVPGRSMNRRIGTGPVDHTRAVQWVERLADVLAAIHERGGVHGAVSPRAVIVSRVRQGLSPVLTNLVVPTSGAFCSPERVTGGGPSARDDLWALSATLYTALSLRAPFAGASRQALARSILDGKVEPLSDVDSELAALVSRGLQKEPEDRYQDARALQVALQEWMNVQGVSSGEDLHSALIAREMLAEYEEQGTGPDAGEPAEEDSTLVAIPELIEKAEAPATSDSSREESAVLLPELGSATAESNDVSAALAPPRLPETASLFDVGDRPKRRRVWLALLAVAAVAAAFAVPYIRGRFGGIDELFRAISGGARPAGGSAASSTASVAQPSQEPSGVLDAAPDAAASAPALPKDPTECMQTLLPTGTFGKEPDLDDVCENTEMWGVGRTVLSRISNRGRGEGVKLWAFIGRYDLPAIAVLREHCCHDAEPFEAATPKTRCGSLTEVLTDLGKRPTPEAAERYNETIECLLAKKVRMPESWNRVSPDRARQTYDEFLELVKKRRRAAAK